MRLIIRDDAAATSNYVANYIVDRINAYKPTPQNPFVLGLPTGSSPLGVYKALVDKYKAGEVSSCSDQASRLCPARWSGKTRLYFFFPYTLPDLL